MTRRTAATLAWSLFGWYVLMTAITLALVAASSATSAQLFVVMAFGFAVVGALVAAREPGNPVGWLLLAAAISVGLQELAAAGPGPPPQAWNQPRRCPIAESRGRAPAGAAAPCPDTSPPEPWSATRRPGCG